MRVSVVIPTYNSAALVVEAVRSALAQSHIPAEVIVVDDGSTDDTGQRLAAFGPPVRYVHQVNQGVAGARNRGIREATCDLIAFLDADDVWHPRKLEMQVECLRGEPALGLIGTSVVDWPNEAFPAFDESARPRPVVVRLNDFVVRNHFTTSSIVVRRDVLERVGHFDRALQGPEDYDLWLRVAQVAAVANLPLRLTGYRDVPGSLGKQAVSMEAGVRIILGKLAAAGVFRGQPLLRRKAWSYLFYSCAYLRGAAGDSPAALRLLVRSLASFPLPYSREEVRMPLARPRLLLRTLLRWFTRSRSRGGERPAPLPSEGALAAKGAVGR